MRAAALFLLLGTACVRTPAPDEAPAGRDLPAAPAADRPSATTVRPGIESFLADVPARLRGKRVGLITNQTAVDRAGRTDIDLIAAHGG